MSMRLMANSTDALVAYSADAFSGLQYWCFQWLTLLMPSVAYSFDALGGSQE